MTKFEGYLILYSLYRLVVLHTLYSSGYTTTTLHTRTPGVITRGSSRPLHCIVTEPILGLSLVEVVADVTM